MEGIISRIEEIEGRTRTEIESCARQEGRSAADIKAVESEVFKLFALLRSLHRDLETAIEESDGYVVLPYMVLFCWLGWVCLIHHPLVYHDCNNAMEW